MGAPVRRTVTAGVIALVCLVGCSSGSSSKRATTTARSTTTAAAVRDLADGTYVGGPAGTPRYFVTVTGASGGSLDGSVGYQYQDGKTAAVFTFSGPAKQGAATVTPSTGGSPIPVTYGSGRLHLAKCTDYLQNAASDADCTFKYSSGGLG